MTRKIWIFILMMPLFTFAQNFQTHYDMGNSRKFVTTTFEMFRPDKWGNTFMFIDFNFSNKKDNNVGLAYMEIARCFSIKNTPFSAHVELNAGMFNANGTALPIENAVLAGVDYGWHNKDFSKTFNLKVLYKNIVGKNPHSFQITTVWNLNYYNNKLTICGFSDFWREDNMNFTNAKGEAIVPTKTNYVFLAEPQIWYNLNKNFSLGGEIELSNNFAAVDGFKVAPTLGAKWTF